MSERASEGWKRFLQLSNIEHFDAGMLHLRHPYELGGAYWLLNMAYTQLGLFVALSIGSTTKATTISESDLRMIAMILSGGWLTAMITLLVSREKGSRNTFYQPMRAWEYNKALFDTGIDEYRMIIFDDHRKYYRWYEGEVKEWLAEVWDELHHTKPVWFTEEAVESVPLDLIPHSNHDSVREEMGTVRVLRNSRLSRIARATMGVRGSVGGEATAIDYAQQSANEFAAEFE